MWISVILFEDLFNGSVIRVMYLVIGEFKTSFYYKLNASHHN